MLILATLFGAALAAAAPEPAEPTFTRAYLKPYSRPERLCFDSPVDLDWEAMARRELKGFPIDNPTPAQIRKQKWDWGVAFSADLPDSLKGLHFYLLTETGPRQIVAERLEGVVRYETYVPGKPKLEGFSGAVCLSIPKDIHDAGFVATSSLPLSWQKSPATLARSGATTMVRLQEGGFSSLPPPGFDQDSIHVKSTYILSSTELAARYVLVRRVADPDEVACEFNYDIYRWEPGLPVVASNAYGCDI